MARLRTLAGPTAPVAPAVPSRDEPTRLGEREVRRLPEHLRVLWQDLADAADTAVRAAASGWDRTEIIPGVPRLTAQEMADMIRRRADLLAGAVVGVQSPHPESGDPAGPAVVPDSMPAADSSRNEPAEPSVPTAPRRMSVTRANTVAAGATLVSGDRETYRWDVVAADGSVLGYVEPAYSGGRRKGWQGRAVQLTRSSNGRQHSTRDAAGADALGQWIRIVTAKPR